MDNTELFKSECQRLNVTPERVLDMCREAWPAFNDQPAEVRGELLGLMLFTIEEVGLHTAGSYANED